MGVRTLYGRMLRSGAPAPCIERTDGSKGMFLRVIGFALPGAALASGFPSMAKTRRGGPARMSAAAVAKEAASRAASREFGRMRVAEGENPSTPETAPSERHDDEEAAVGGRVARRKGLPPRLPQGSRRGWALRSQRRFPKG